MAKPRHRNPEPKPAPQSAAASPAPAAKPRLDRKNLVVRVGTALVFAVFFLSLLYFGGDTVWGRYAYLALMGGSAFLGVREFTLIGRKMGYNPSLPAAAATAMLLLLHFATDRGPASADPALPLWVVLVLGGLIIHFGALFFDKDLEKALPSQAITWLAALYLGLGLGFQQKLFQFEGTLPKTGSRLILALYIIVWFGDTAAYFVGSTFGRHKLAPRVSPKKSWEGAGGNLAGNLLGAWLMQATVCPEWSLLYALGMGLVLGIAGQLGDLVESTWKRSAGVKDSNVGVSIPGHGGVLDRVDSLVFAAPLMYAYLVYVH